MKKKWRCQTYVPIASGLVRQIYSIHDLGPRVVFLET